MEILGRDGNLGPSMKTKWPIIVHRDDEPDDAFEVMGTWPRLIGCLY